MKKYSIATKIYIEYAINSLNAFLNANIEEKNVFDIKTCDLQFNLFLFE